MSSTTATHGGITNDALVSAVRCGLRRDFGDITTAPKRIATAIRGTARAVSNWLYGVNAPQSAQLLNLMLVSPATMDAVLDLLERQAAQLDPVQENLRRRLENLRRSHDRAAGEVLALAGARVDAHRGVGDGERGSDPAEGQSPGGAGAFLTVERRRTER